LGSERLLGFKVVRPIEAGAVLTWEDLGFVSG
jgi:hypothetical protein